MESITPPMDLYFRFTSDRPFREIQEKCIDPRSKIPRYFCGEVFWKKYAQKYGYRKLNGITWEESIDRATDPKRNIGILYRINGWDMFINPEEDINRITITTETEDEGEFDVSLEEKDLPKIIFDKPIIIKIRYDEFNIEPDTPNGISLGHFMESIHKNFWLSQPKYTNYVYGGLKKLGPNYYEVIIEGEKEQRQKEKI